MKQTLLLTLLLALVGCTSTGTQSQGPPPPDAAAQTRKKLDETKEQISVYYRNYGSFPKSLKDLSWVNGGDDYKDGWGNTLVYSVGRDKTVRLWSFGADGAIGGAGENQDIAIKFNELDVTPSVADRLGEPKKKWF